jgi:protein-S-isoprenylcysteine O-methyltransferase Ste14
VKMLKVRGYAIQAIFWLVIASGPISWLEPNWMSRAIIVHPNPLTILGAFATILPGWILLLQAHAALGHNWFPGAAIVEEQTLTTKGPYRLVRNPIYVAYIAIIIGFSILYLNWIFLAGSIIAAITLLARVPREEKLLSEHFGEEYHRYRSRTGRYLPRLHRRRG